MFVNVLRQPRANAYAGLAASGIFLALTLAFTIPFFILKTARSPSHEEPTCMANGEPLWPWNESINEYWDPSTALSITLGGAAKYTYPEAKSIDVAWDLLVGRGGQLIAAIMAFSVIRRSLMLCMEKQAVPIPLAFNVYFRSATYGLLGAIFQNLAIPYWHEEKHNKRVSLSRLLGWLYLTVYVLVIPTLISAMTGYQTTAKVYFDSYTQDQYSIVDGSNLKPNPGLIVRDGSRVGLADNASIALNFTGTDVDIGASVFNSNLTYDIFLDCQFTAITHVLCKFLTDVSRLPRNAEHFSQFDDSAQHFGLPGRFCWCWTILPEPEERNTQLVLLHGVQPRRLLLKMGRPGTLGTSACRCSPASRSCSHVVKYHSQ
jgi:hypothetical protein